jgi:Uma2 family endonuclease
VRLGDSSEPQPDAALFILPGHGGRVRISVDDYLENGPELVAEVAASSIPLDTGLKLQMYLRYDVQEYIICRVPDHEIDWFVRRDSQFVQLAPDQDGRLCSEVFPGLWLDADALIRGDMAQVLSVLQLGLATAEHAAFVSRLNPPAS